MDVKELTMLMHDILKCEQAINLDGGGSSTMWIREQPFNGVVNYPTDNNRYDHEGSKSKSMALILTPKN